MPEQPPAADREAALSAAADLLDRRTADLNRRATAALHALVGAGRLISPFGTGMMVDDRGFVARVATVEPVCRPPGHGSTRIVLDSAPPRAASTGLGAGRQRWWGRLPSSSASTTP